MIVKAFEETAHNGDARLQAGITAEKQMAFYLHRSFSDDPDIFVLHNLRLEDPAQPEHHGSPGVCQIDHLLVHRFGFFIIECKSVTGEVRVRPDNSGGDEWTRMHGRKETGMPSPIQQAQRQASFLRIFLQSHRQNLLGRQSLGLRTIAKVVHGSDQRGFKSAPIQLVIAVSDKGKIKRLGGWEPSHNPFQIYVTKADLVSDKISKEVERHRKGAKSTNKKAHGEYGMWSMDETEIEHVARFLAEQHLDFSGAPKPRPKQTAPKRNRRPSREKAIGTGHPVKAACKHCGSIDLTARSGPYGYFWRCSSCEKNTAMPVVCSTCRANGKRNKKVRIRKEKGSYLRDCEACGTSEPIWTER